MPARHDFKALNRAAVDAEGAFIDGRLKNIAFKHKQLRALFRILQDNGETILAATRNPGRCALELEHCLQVISETIEELPSDLVKAAKALRALVDPKAKQGRKDCGAGTVLIVANETHPIASWVVPLVTAFYDGNAAIVSFPSQSAVHSTLVRPLRSSMDQSSFHFVMEDPSALNTWLKSGPTGLAGLVCFGDLPGTDKDDLVLPIRKFTVHIPARGHNPVIIDQSVVPSALLQGMAMTRSDGTTSKSCPDEVRNAIQDIASSIAQAYHIARGADDMKDKSGSASSGVPGYLLVHENVSALMIPALKSTLPPNFQPHVQALDAAEDILASSQLDYLPVFSVRSLDHAMDTVTNRLPSSPLAYVFAEKRFGEYAAGNLERKSVAINDIPRRLAIAGAYASRKDFTVNRERVFWESDKPSRDYGNPDKSYKGLKVAKLHQAGGFRIDFFGGSFLFAASIFLTCFLGTSGWLIYRGGLLALARWRGGRL
ncbi:hypothetical protein HD553DRAFT_350791 [Filobasidium floriforme]|uniref:uncharacterized protein n=1 Tax=Filobasidium floriforme TaxID=5210 RepID=UPI001E8D8A16|nr:uncharacterized protein HD553DRAFT_350791 [Filobasidium floriforme]KAH8083134.1 hypothetical protein HD553DRAFT_350791 [Filobasidium floriforme]